MYTLKDSIAYAQPFIEDAPLTAGNNFEPALSIATMTRNLIMSASDSWPWNRNEYQITAPNALRQNQQDYVFPITDFYYLEKASLLNAAGDYGYELKNVYNTLPLGIPSLSDETGQAQPNGVAVLLYNPGINAKFRFLPIPDQAYTGVLTYQKAPLPFTAANIAAVEVVSGGAYYVFTTAQPQFDNNVLQGQSIWVQNFDEPSNNGTFTCTASTDQMLTLSNTAAVPDSSGGTAINQSWYPIPDSFMHIYNNLFLAEALDAF